MLRIGIYLECSDGECEAVFPTFCGKPMPLDGAFHTKRYLRAEAKKRGWQSYDQNDYCPRCEIKHRAEATKGGK